MIWETMTIVCRHELFRRYRSKTSQQCSAETRAREWAGRKHASPKPRHLLLFVIGFKYFVGTLSVNQTPLSEMKNLKLSLYICSASTVKTNGFPCLCPTLIAVSKSLLKCTCCLLP